MGEEAVLIFDYYPRGTLQEYVEMYGHAVLRVACVACLPGACCADVCCAVVCVRVCRQRMNGRVLPESRCLQIFAGICLGLREMHHHEPPWAHRDIKTANVLLSSDNRPVLMVRDHAWDFCVPLACWYHCE